jgi:hypothetical protein
LAITTVKIEGQGSFLFLEQKAAGVGIGLTNYSHWEGLSPTLLVFFQPEQALGVSMVLNRAEKKNLLPSVTFCETGEGAQELPIGVSVILCYRNAGYEFISTLFPKDQLKDLGTSLLEEDFGIMLCFPTEFSSKDEDAVSSFCREAKARGEFVLVFCCGTYQDFATFCVVELAYNR